MDLPIQELQNLSINQQSYEEQGQSNSQLTEDEWSKFDQIDVVLKFALCQPKCRLTVIQIEQEVEQLVSDKSTNQYTFDNKPTSYQRLLTYKVSQYWGLQTKTGEYTLEGPGQIQAIKPINYKPPKVQLQTLKPLLTQSSYHPVILPTNKKGQVQEQYSLHYKPFATIQQTEQDIFNKRSPGRQNSETLKEQIAHSQTFQQYLKHQERQQLGNQFMQKQLQHNQFQRSNAEEPTSPMQHIQQPNNQFSNTHSQQKKQAPPQLQIPGMQLPQGQGSYNNIFPLTPPPLNLHNQFSSATFNSSQNSLLYQNPLNNTQGYQNQLVRSQQGLHGNFAQLPYSPQTMFYYPPNFGQTYGQAQSPTPGFMSLLDYPQAQISSQQMQYGTQQFGTQQISNQSFLGPQFSSQQYSSQQFSGSQVSTQNTGSQQYVGNQQTAGQQQFMGNQQFMGVQSYFIKQQHQWQQQQFQQQQQQQQYQQQQLQQQQQQTQYLMQQKNQLTVQHHYQDLQQGADLSLSQESSAISQPNLFQISQTPPNDPINQQQSRSKIQLSPASNQARQEQKVDQVEYTKSFDKEHARGDTYRHQGVGQKIIFIDSQGSSQDQSLTNPQTSGLSQQEKLGYGEQSSEST